MQIDINTVKKLFPKRKNDSNKGTYGKVLNIAGSKFYPGAAILSSLSALKVGAGYVRLACPENISDITMCYPDITVMPLPEDYKLAADKICREAESYTVLSAGSGLSDEPCVFNFILEILPRLNIPCVLDADVLNAVARSGICELPVNTVITPHPGELSRLLGVDTAVIQSNRQKYALIAAKKYSCTVVLKGNGTIITDGNTVYLNTTGSSALSKAGTGDVLTGMIAGLAAQGLSLFDASLVAVFLHGLASDIALPLTTEYSLLASDLISYIPLSVRKIIENV